MPVCVVRRVPLLVDASGSFRWRFTRLLMAAGMLNRADLLDQIEIELEAQLDRLHQDGIRPDHINGERHVHLIPGIFERVVAAARRRGISYVRAGRDLGAPFFHTRDAIQLALSGGAVKSWLLSILSTRNRAHLTGNVSCADYVASYLYTGRADRIISRLLAMPAYPGVTEVMVHPGIPEENGALALGNRELERYLMSNDRRVELNACIAARSVAGSWRLTNYRQLAAMTSAC